MERLYLFLFLLLFFHVTRADELPAGRFNVAKPTIEGIPGTTCLNVVTITNQTDVPWVLRLQAVVPARLHLLSSVPATVTIPAHGTLSLPMKLFIDRQWTDAEATVRLDAYERNAPLPVASAQFVVQQSRTVGNTLVFSFLNDRPYLAAGQDTLPLQLHLVNDSYQTRRLRLSLRSLPDGFVLPALFSTVQLPPRRDTLLTLPVLVTSRLQWSQSYTLLLDVLNDADGALLGTSLCMPVLLTSMKRQLTNPTGETGPNGVLLGVTRLGSFGYFSELRAWGEQAYGAGTLSFGLNALSFTDRGRTFLDLRDTYLQYSGPTTQFRFGSLYDNHELPLIGIGAKAAVTRGHTQLEGWAVLGRNTFFNAFGPSLFSRVFSLRLSGGLPLGTGGVYGLSASRYEMSLLSRAGWLSHGTASWQLSSRSRLRLLAATSLENSTSPVIRQQTIGWAAGGDYHYASERLTFDGSGYYSTPVYGGYQRGLTRLDNLLRYRLSQRTTLSYHLSLLEYDQRYVGGRDQELRRFFRNNWADVSLTQRFGQVALTLRPYYWQQAQATTDSARQATDTYRFQTTLHLEPRYYARLELGLDVGRYRGLTPATDQYAINTYRLLTNLTYRAFTLFGQYQRGPYLLSDRLPGLGDPRDTRQIMLAPNWLFSGLGGRLQGGFGATLMYTTQNRAWSGVLRHSAGLAVTNNLQVRWNINLMSTATQLALLRPDSPENALANLEVVRTFSGLRIAPRRQIRLRFYEDENANQQRDGRENWLEGVVINIREANGKEVPLLTDHKGTITYKTQRAGLYLVKAVCVLASGEPILYSDSIQLQRTVDREVPIRKTWPVKGTLHQKRARFDATAADLDGFRVEARAADGELLRTYADEAGRFTLYLPAGDYQVSVINNRVYPPKPVTTMPYRVAPGVPPAPIRLEFDLGGRPAQIKRFSAR